MEVEVICREVSVRPSIRMRTIKAERIAVMAIDSDGTLTGAGSKISFGCCIVAYERDYYTIVAVHLLNSGKVLTIGELYIRQSLRVFVLRLEEDHGAAITA
jgi:hypothetical protein